MKKHNFKFRLLSLSLIADIVKEIDRERWIKQVFPATKKGDIE